MTARGPVYGPAVAYDLTLTEEQQALIQTARDFTRKEIIPVAAHYDESGEFPREIIKKAWQTGLTYMEAPESVGGLGGSCLDHCLVQEEISYGCLGFNTSIIASSLGSMPVIIAGTADRMAHPDHAHSLWHHWKHPKIYWFPGNHLLHCEKTHYMREVVAFLRGLRIF